MIVMKPISKIQAGDIVLTGLNDEPSLVTRVEKGMPYNTTTIVWLGGWGCLSNMAEVATVQLENEGAC